MNDKCGRRCQKMCDRSVVLLCCCGRMKRERRNGGKERALNRRRCLLVALAFDSLPSIHCLRFTAFDSLPSIHCPSPTAFHSLPFTHCLPFTTKPIHTHIPLAKESDFTREPQSQPCCHSGLDASEDDSVGHL